MIRRPGARAMANCGRRTPYRLRLSGVTAPGNPRGAHHAPNRIAAKYPNAAAAPVTNVPHITSTIATAAG